MYSRETKALVDRREMLRIKVKSLAEEARIIRREEQRTWGVLREELHNHRVVELRRAARCAHLAYGLVKGRAYAQMEPGNMKMSGPQGSFFLIDWAAVLKMVQKYGSYDLSTIRDELGRKLLEEARAKSMPRTGQPLRLAPVATE